MLNKLAQFAGDVADVAAFQIPKLDLTGEAAAQLLAQDFWQRLKASWQLTLHAQASTEAVGRCRP